MIEVESERPDIVCFHITITISIKCGSKLSWKTLQKKALPDISPPGKSPEKNLSKFPVHYARRPILYSCINPPCRNWCYRKTVLLCTDASTNVVGPCWSDQSCAAEATKMPQMSPNYFADASKVFHQPVPGIRQRVQ